MRKSIFNKTLYFIFFCFFFGLFSNNVFAIKFVTNGEGPVHYNDYFTVKADGGHYTTRKWYTMGNNAELNSSKYAYCASRMDSFAKNTNKYKEFKEWQFSNICTYIVDGKKYPNGDCSVILGFIIKEALKDKGPSTLQGWLLAQGSIWTYLYYFTNNNKYRWRNEPANKNKSWDSHIKMKELFNNAWGKYYKATNNGKISLAPKDDVNFTVDASNGGNKFSYVPNGDSCITNGNYLTNKIKITNNEEKVIHITIEKKWDDVYICDSNNCDGSKKFDLMPGYTQEIYLKTSAILPKSLIYLDVKAEYSSGNIIEEPIYDTRLFVPVGSDRHFKEGAQRMIIMEEKNDINSYETKHSTTKEIEISQTPIKHYSCSSSTNNKNGYLNSNTSTTPISRVCASGTNGEKEINEDKYKASFQDCTCTTVNIGKNISVGVILVETVVFRFGTLDLDVVYPGGGFGLDVDNKNGGTPTNYYSELTWYFADTDLSGNPYYYDSSSKTGNVASGSMKTTLENGVRKSLENMIKDNNVVINIKSLDSNDALNTNDYNTKLNVNYDKIYYNGHTFKVEDEHLDMNKAYFSEDGKVSYVANSKYTLDGGNKYYVPLKYQNNKFPYSIDVSNLSLTGKFNFYYKASCEIIVNDYIYDYTYRTIDVTAPFSKTNLATSANWAYWWNGNISNQNRIKLTYRDYPNNPTYDVRLSNDYISKILSYNKLYTNWDTVNDDGSNTFISGNYGFITIARGGNSGSYCEIGKFNDSCDK